MQQFKTRPQVVLSNQTFGAKLDSKGRVTLLTLTSFTRPGKYYGTPYWCQVSKEHNNKEYIEACTLLGISR